MDRCELEYERCHRPCLLGFQHVSSHMGKCWTGSTCRLLDQVTGQWFPRDACLAWRLLCVYISARLLAPRQAKVKDKAVPQLRCFTPLTTHSHLTTSTRKHRYVSHHINYPNPAHTSNQPNLHNSTGRVRSSTFWSRHCHFNPITTASTRLATAVSQPSFDLPPLGSWWSI